MQHRRRNERIATVVAWAGNEQHVPMWRARLQPIGGSFARARHQGEGFEGSVRRRFQCADAGRAEEQVGAGVCGHGTVDQDFAPGGV